MKQYIHSVSLVPDRCKGCTTCLKRCPTEAIRIRDGHAVIKSERCIDCGECIRTCPYQAKKATYDKIENFDKELKLPYTNTPYLDNTPKLINTEIVDPNGEIAKHIENYFTNRQFHKNGLHGLMNCLILGHNTDDPWAGHMWYTGFVDQEWFNVYMKQERFEEVRHQGGNRGGLQPFVR